MLSGPRADFASRFRTVKDSYDIKLVEKSDFFRAVFYRCSQENVLCGELKEGTHWCSDNIVLLAN